MTNDVNLLTNDGSMAKQIKKKKINEDLQTIANEDGIAYLTPKRTQQITELPYSKFEKIAEKVPFTLKEWASVLYLSERTLQRYAKDNKNFDGIYTEKISHINQLIEIGLETFDNSEALYAWLRRDKNILGRKINFESLYSMQGIQNTIDQLLRIQHGIYT